MDATFKAEKLPHNAGTIINLLPKLGLFLSLSALLSGCVTPNKFANVSVERRSTSAKRVFLSDFDPFGVQQTGTNLCWAACVQSLLRYHRISNSSFEQTGLSLRLFGYPDAPASPKQIQDALQNTRWNHLNDFNERVRLILAFPPKENLPIVNRFLQYNWSEWGVQDAIRHGHPVLVGSQDSDDCIGHARLIIGMELRGSIFPSITHVQLFDPGDCSTTWHSVRELLLPGAKGFIILVFVN